MMAKSKAKGRSPIPSNKKNSFDQFLELFENLKVTNGYDDKKAAEEFHALVDQASQIETTFGMLKDPRKDSYVDIKKMISSMHISNRVSSFLNLADLPIKWYETVDHLLSRIKRGVFEVYGEGFNDAQRNRLIKDLFIFALPKEIRPLVINVDNMSESVMVIKERAKNLYSKKEFPDKPVV